MLSVIKASVANVCTFLKCRTLHLLEFVIIMCKGTSHSLLSKKNERTLYQDFRYKYMFAKFAFIREISPYTQETQQL